MTPRKGKNFRTSAKIEDLTLTHAHAAGIDVHAAVHFVAVSPADVPAGFVNADPKLPAAEVRRLYGGFGGHCRVVDRLRGDDSGDGIDGGVLDSSVRTSR